ncbi:MAG TPA: response regulator [Steroidobacteraceae bacterium]|nr:response regulator [Steroidobacteraceae bacterium]
MAARSEAQETRRLEALHASGILAAPGESALEQLTALAARSCAAPIACLALLDADCEHYKASVGLALEQLPRESALSAESVRTCAALIVDDTRRDARFARHPFVIAEPRIRFLAAVPVSTADGCVLGALCVAARAPRVLTAEQHGTLQALAQQAAAVIEQVRRIGELRAQLAERERAHHALVAESHARSGFLVALSGELARIGEPQALVCAAMLKLRDRLSATRAILAELDHEARTAILLTQCEGEDLKVETLQLPANSLGVEVESLQGFTTIVQDTRRDSRTAHLYEQWYEPRGVSSLVAVPLLRGGLPVAQLSVINAAPRRWVPSEVELIERVADIVWPAFEKARADRQAEELLQESNQRKDEFLAMLAHELRNPLAPIRNAAQILRLHSKGNSKLEWARAVIERQSRHLTRLVDDLLDVSRIVRGQITLETAPVDLHDVVEHALETSRPLLKERKHQLAVSVPAAELRLDADLTRLSQVFANLLINAAKYTPEGGRIWLEAEQRASEAIVRVRDTGMGISSALLPYVFDLFTQGTRTLDRAQGGLGIGLTLVKKIVEMHGGTVAARSPGLGLGSEFSVCLPLREGTVIPKRAPEETPVTRVPVPAQHVRVLVVDDNVDAAESIAMLISIAGHEVRSVHDAQDALETAQSFQPDVVLLDIGLPGMDGYEVARRLRSQPAIHSMRLVAVTGYGQQSDRERALEAGFDQHLVKPVEPEALHALLGLVAPVGPH